MQQQQMRTKKKKLKIAIVHDWIFTKRGGEKVLEQILSLFPQAHLYYLFGNPKKYLNLKHPHKCIPSFLNKMPFIHKIYKRIILCTYKICLKCILCWIWVSR